MLARRLRRRAAVWADYNGDGKPDLLLATPTGPKLLHQPRRQPFRDDSHLLPQEPCYNLTAAAWIDYDGDGKPDILLANGYHGLRLYRNIAPRQIRRRLRPCAEGQGVRGRLREGRPRPERHRRPTSRATR